jgi:hypothetical protein
MPSVARQSAVPTHTLNIASIHQLPGWCCWSKQAGSAPLTNARLQSATARPSSVVSALLLLLLLLLRQLEPSGCSTVGRENQHMKRQQWTHCSADVRV